MSHLSPKPSGPCSILLPCLHPCTHSALVTFHGRIIIRQSMTLNVLKEREHVLMTQKWGASCETREETISEDCLLCNGFYKLVSVVHCIWLVLLLCVSIIQHITVIMLQSCDQCSLHSPVLQLKEYRAATKMSFKITQILTLHLLHIRKETTS